MFLSLTSYLTKTRIKSGIIKLNIEPLATTLFLFFPVLLFLPPPLRGRIEVGASSFIPSPSPLPSPIKGEGNNETPTSGNQLFSSSPTSGEDRGGGIFFHPFTLTPVLSRQWRGK